jgi:hypothetical protein
MTLRPRILLATAIALLSAVGLMEIYCRTPLDVRLPPLQLPDEETLTLVFHGSVDADNPQFSRLVEALEREGNVVSFVRWDPWSDTRLRAAASAQRVGEQVAEQLIAQWEKTGRLRNLKLIAHSSGAYVLDALCERLRERMATPPNIDMLFVDPFQIHGFVDWAHGAREHGRCADRAEAIINTDDPAPATNRPLAHARNVDVTLDVRRANFKENGHYWALEYLILESADRTH